MLSVVVEDIHNEQNIWGGGMERKMELTYIKLGPAYYGMCSNCPVGLYIIEKSAHSYD